MSQRVLMNKETGQIGLAIPILFFEHMCSRELDAMPDYNVSITPHEPDGWLMFTGEIDAEGPWIFVKRDVIYKKTVDLGEL